MIQNGEPNSQWSQEIYITQDLNQSSFGEWILMMILLTVQIHYLIFSKLSLILLTLS